MTSTENKPAPREWFIQKPIAHNCPVGQSGPLNQIGAVFQVFRPTVALQGHEWVHVVEMSALVECQEKLKTANELIGELKKTLDWYACIHWPDCSLAYRSDCDCGLPDMASRAFDNIKEYEEVK